MAEDREKLSKVTKGKVTRSKPSGLQKFTNLFLDEDIDSIKDYAINDLIVPGISNGIIDILGMLLPGANRSRSRGRSRREPVEYNSMYDKGVSNSSRSKYAQERSRRKYKTVNDVLGVTFETRLDADNVLSDLDYHVRKFGTVTVGDFFDAAGISDDNFTNRDFGWYIDDIRNAYISRARGGYIIVLPPAVQLD